MKRPIGIAQEFAGEQYEIGLASADDFVGLVRIRYHSDCSRQDFRFALDAFGERNLVAGADLHFCVRDHGAGRTIDQVDLPWFEFAGERDGIVQRPAAFFPICRGDADEQRESIGPDAANGLGQFEDEANSILKRSAVLIGAVVGERREKFVREISVGAVKLERFESGGEGAACGLGESVDDGIDSGERESFWNWIGCAERDRAGGDRLQSAGFDRNRRAVILPRHVAACFSSGVGDLDAGNRAMFFDECGNALQHRDVFVFIDAVIAGADASARFDGGGFHDDEPSAAYRAAAEVHEVPIGRESVNAGVLTHGRDGDAIAIVDLADCERGKKVWVVQKTSMTGLREC